jgi:hypothetical protein
LSDSAGKISDRQIHLALFELVRELRRRHRHRADAALRRAGAQRRHHPRQERHLADIRQRQRPGARARRGVERLAAEQILLEPSESGRASLTMACARGVGVTPLGTRMNSGSSNAMRIRLSAMLTAGWLMPSSRAARLTLSSS